MTLGLFRRKIWLLASEWERWKYTHIYGHIIGQKCIISHKSLLDKGIRGIVIGDGTRILHGAIILAHDHCRALVAPPHVGRDCIIGTRSMIMPGVIIGDEVVVAAQSVVTKDIPSHCIVAGNPAKVLKIGVSVRDGLIVDEGQRVE